MYRVLLVDDEFFSREALKRFHWETYGWEVCGEANNGYAGVEKAMQLKPDVVLADINMPFLDGLSMIGQLKELELDALYAIITGYSEFEYAKRGIALGVEDFIVKPIDDDALAETVMKMTAILDKRRTEQQERRSLLFWAAQNAVANRQQFLQMLLFGNTSMTPERFQYECGVLRLCLQHGGYGVCVLRAPAEQAARFRQDHWQEELQKIIVGAFPARAEICHVDDSVYLIFSGIAEADWDIVKLRGLLQQIQTQLIHLLQCSVMTGVGTWGPDHTQIPQLRAAAEDAAANRATSKLIAQTVQHIHENYADVTLNVTQIAKELYVNYSYLSAQFTREIGMPASQYILRLRMNKAADALRAGRSDMLQIATSVGYTDLRYFYRCFKKEFGVTPYQYLERTNHTQEQTREE